MQTIYVLGFMFSVQEHCVALIRKSKPQWQAGKLNGIGGKVEATDSSAHAAMVREFMEETGVSTIEEQWSLFCTMDDGPLIHCFVSISEQVWSVHTLTTEPISIYPLSAFKNENHISNLDWLIPMALDAVRNNFRASAYYLNVKRS